MKYENSFGIEMETLVFDETYNPYYVPVELLSEKITKDFANHQLEFVTGVEKSTQAVAKQMCKSVNSLKLNVLAWPLSVPGAINYEIEVANLENKAKVEYRKELLKKYSAKMQLLCGIHYNFSYDEKMIKKMFSESGEENYKKFKSNMYFSIFKKLYKFAPILIFFNSFTPFYNADFEPKLLNELQKIGQNYGLENSISLRNGLKTGYCNDLDIEVDLSSLEKYRDSIKKNIASGKIIGEQEIYSKFRLKAKGSMLENDINYVELRFMDKNPYHCCSFTVEQLDFIHIFMRWFIQTEDITVDNATYSNFLENTNNVSLNGLDENLKIDIDGVKIKFNEWAFKTLESIKKQVELSSKELRLINKYQKNLKDYKSLPIYNMRKNILDSNLTIDEFGKKYIQNRI